MANRSQTLTALVFITIELPGDSDGVDPGEIRDQLAEQFKLRTSTATLKGLAATNAEAYIAWDTLGDVTEHDAKT